MLCYAYVTLFVSVRQSRDDVPSLLPHVVRGPGPGTQRHALRSTKALCTQEYVSLFTKHMSFFDFWQRQELYRA